MKHNNIRLKLAALLASAALVVGCATSQGPGTAAGSGTNSVASANTDTVNLSSTMFTDRDIEIGYDESTCVAVALSDSGSTASGAGVSIEGKVVSITAEGSYILTGALSDGQIVVNVSDTEKVQLILNGVDIKSSDTAPIYVLEADKTFVTLAQDTQNTLSVTGAFISTDDNNVDAAIFSKGDLTLNGSGALTIESAYGNGISSKDDLAITSGNYTVTAAGHALEGKDSVRVASGTFSLTAGEDALHSDNTEDADRGFVYIDGGDFNITSGDDGIHAETAVNINGGTINIKDSYEGIEGHIITLSGGEIAIISSDDGLNAAGGVDNSGQNGRQAPGAFAADNAAAITIAGGKITINAEGDGIDSNGALSVTGGEVYVWGPVNSGNSALDYNGVAGITGGIVVATDSGGMSQNFGDTSTQGSMLVSAGSTQSGAIVLKDSSGKERFSCTPAKSYATALISIPGLAVGDSYTLTMGANTQGISLSTLIYGNGGGMGGARGQGGMKDAGGVPPSGGMGGVPPTGGINGAGDEAQTA